MAKRKKTELLPTFKPKSDGEDLTVVLEEDKQVKIIAVKDVSTKHGDKIVATVELDDKRYNVFLNATSQNNLIDAFGDDDERWIGKLIDLKKERNAEFKSDMIVAYPVA